MAFPATMAVGEAKKIVAENPPPELTQIGGDFYRIDFRALGTECRVEFRASLRRAAVSFRDEAFRWVCDFERKYSRFLPDSLISEINRQAGNGWVETDAELESMLSLCGWFYWNTGGAFDPTTLPLTALWNHEMKQQCIPTDAQVQEALALTGWQKVQRESGRVFLPQKGMALDLGGIGKEYAVDRVFELAVKHNLPDVLVNFGGDLRVRGEAPTGGLWRVGLEDPADPGRCWCGLAFTDRAVATSGDYFRAFHINGRRYSHIIDPRTGWPIGNQCHSASVIAESCTEAGILSTTGLVLGAEKGIEMMQRSRHVEGCVRTDERIYETRQFRQYVI
jgi:thiamine biosynthesis lipoprotein